LIYALVSLMRAALDVENFFIIRIRLAGGIFKNVIGGSIGRPAFDVRQFPGIDDALDTPPPIMAI